jgi:hypothetical protein
MEVHHEELRREGLEDRGREVLAHKEDMAKDPEEEVLEHHNPLDKGKVLGNVVFYNEGSVWEFCMEEASKVGNNEVLHSVYRVCHCVWNVCGCDSSDSSGYGCDYDCDYHSILFLCDWSG